MITLTSRPVLLEPALSVTERSQMARVPAILIKINGFFRSQNTQTLPPDLALFTDKVLFLRRGRPVQPQILPDHRPACHRPIQFQKCDAQSRRSILNLGQNIGRRFGRLGRIGAVDFHRHSITPTFKVHTIGALTHEQIGFNVFVLRRGPKPFQMSLTTGVSSVSSAFTLQYGHSKVSVAYLASVVVFGSLRQKKNRPLELPETGPESGFVMSVAPRPNGQGARAH